MAASSLRRALCRVGWHHWHEEKRTCHPILAAWYVVHRCLGCGKPRGEFRPLRRSERRILQLPEGRG